MIVALLGATGGDWGVLQSIAWTRMIAENLQTDSLQAALTKTFDGQHPCGLCKAIDAGKKSEKKSELPSAGKRLEFPLWASKFNLISPKPCPEFSQTDLSADLSFPQPPVPPPRRLFA